LAKRIAIHQNEVGHIICKADCIDASRGKADISSSIQAVILVVIADVLVTGTELEWAILIVAKKNVAGGQKELLKPISSVQLRGIELIISSGVRQALYTKTVSIEFTVSSNFFVKLRACKYRVTDIGTRYRNLRRRWEWNFCHVLVAL